jgi:hypothetical protein
MEAHRGAASRRRGARNGYEGTVHERVESLDYEEGDGDGGRAGGRGDAGVDVESKSYRRDMLLNAAVRWALCLLTGEGTPSHCCEPRPPAM